MVTFTLYLKPSEYAAVNGITIYDVLQLIHTHQLTYIRIDEELRIPVTYVWSDNR